jgi:hypothetical protein
MIRIRVKKAKHDRLVVGTTIFTDERVSLFAKGLFCTALAMAQHKGFDITELLDAVPDSKDEVYKGIMELRKFRYCKRVRVGNNVEFRFREDPQKASREASGVLKNKSPSIYSKSMAHRDREHRQGSIREETSPEFADWDEISPDSTQTVSQPTFLPERVKKKQNGVDDQVPKVAHLILQRLCYMADTVEETLLISSSDRGRIASALGKLRDAGADLTKLAHFEDWWNSHWRSKDKVTGAYQPPRPEQVVEFWTIAMKHNYKPIKLVPTPIPHIDINLTEMMRSRANDRKI